KTQADRDWVDQMQRFLEQPVQQATVRPPVTAVDAPSEVPRMVRQPLPVERPPFTPSPEVEGSFVELVCLEKSLKVVILTAQGKKAFLISDPGQVVIVGRTGGKVDLNCGPQSAVNVKLEYIPSTSRA